MAISVVQHIGTRSVANATTVDGTISASAAGSILVVGSGNGNGHTVTGVADNKGNTYVQAFGSAAVFGATEFCDIWYCLAPASGVVTVTITYSGVAGTFSKDVFVWEVAGFVTPIFDIAATRQNETGIAGALYNGPTVGTIGSSGFIAAVVTPATTVDLNPNTGNEFSSGGDISPSGDAGCSLIFSSSASHTPVWHATGTGNNYCATMAVFCEQPTFVAGVQFDSVGPGAGAAAASSSLSWTHQCSGSNRLLIVGVAVGVNPDTGITAAVTYNSVSMTSVGSAIHSNSGIKGFVQIFQLKAPDTGVNTVLVTLTGGTATIEGGSVSFTNVDQTTPLDAPATAVGASTTPSVNVTSAVGDMVIDAVCNGSAINTSNQTLRWLYNKSSATQAGEGAGSIAKGAASVTMSYAVTSDSWGIIGVNINAAPSGSVDVITRGPDQWQVIVN